VNRTQIDGARDSATPTIRRAHATDFAALGGFFAALSPQTRFLRFFAPVTPNGAMLARLSGGAGGAGSTDVVVAIAGGVIIGHAMAVDRAGLHGDQLADIGVVVADAWQGQGIGSALVRALITRAQGRGVTSLTMDVLHGNHQVLAMIAARWGTGRTDYRADCVTVQVHLPQHQQERPHPARGARPPAARRAARPVAQSPAGRSRALTGSRP
jgi:ribosomal protein S18 acetylase RimI-like enzyme